MSGSIHRRNYVLTVFVGAATLVVTWGVRLWVERSLSYGVPMVVVGDVFRLMRSENSGVAFSLLRNSPLVPWLSTLALVAVAVYLARPLQRSWFGSVVLGLILGGGLANLLDRLNDGRVTDYLDVGLGTWRYPTFNLPDTAIVIGILLSLWLLVRYTPRGQPDLKGES